MQYFGICEDSSKACNCFNVFQLTPQNIKQDILHLSTLPLNNLDATVQLPGSSLCSRSKVEVAENRAPPLNVRRHMTTT